MAKPAPQPPPTARTPLPPMPDHRGDLWIASTVSDRIQGAVLGIGTTTALVSRIELEAQL
jgi:hypothetical protein